MLNTQDLNNVSISQPFGHLNSSQFVPEAAQPVRIYVGAQGPNKEFVTFPIDYEVCGYENADPISDETLFID